MSNLIVVQNDKKYDFNFTVTDANAEVIDLTDSVIKFKVANYINPSALVVNATCTVITATLGTCKYTIQSNDFITVGNYRAELEISYVTSGQVITAQGININVAPKLGV